MFTRWTGRILRIRRALSRSEWAVRLLGLPRLEGQATAPGLLLVQIDGLSWHQFRAALERGRLPHLRRLLHREHYRLHTFYSGLPSSTPAVQGELFYGVRCVVPAFGFRDPERMALVRMSHPGPASRIEIELQKQGGEALLEGGSAYGDIYAGGAQHAHFCAATVGWDEVWKAINPLRLLSVLLWHAWSFVRVTSLTIVELGLAIVDCVRGLVDGHHLWKELSFIPARVAVSILLREMITIGATLDLTRGLPIVHVNLLGYDEQAHRRGPTSEFAHWTLRGIDRAIRDLWRAARRSGRRDYDIWVYSDHGQEETTPYETLCGCSIDEVIERIYGEQVQDGRTQTPVRYGVQLDRASWLGGRRIQKLFAPFIGADEPVERPVQVTALGPIAHVYFPREHTRDELAEFARRLVEAQVPAVLVPIGDEVLAFWNGGEGKLPDNLEQVAGAQHPWLEALREDLMLLCQNRYSGHLILSGWQADRKAVSFALEHGSHAGFGPEETTGFALLPPDAPVPEHRGPLRPELLRDAALVHLGRRSSTRRRRPPGKPRTLRIMTYNVHACIGMDGQLSPDRIARVIRQSRADVVALQELDVGRERTGAIDQAHEIARILEMDFHFHPAWQVEEEAYGNAVLSHLPLQLVHRGALPGLPGREPRGALWVELEVDGQPVQLINTHLGLRDRERQAQVEALLGDEWLGHPRCQSPVVLCGDFNASPRSRPYARVRRQLADAQLQMNGHRPLPTWISGRPFHRIDHVFISPDLRVRKVQVSRSQLASMASDHLPLLVEIEVP